MNARILLTAACLVCVASFVQPAQAANSELVHFRLTDWKSMHLHDAKQVQTLHETFTKIGCECKRESHGDHYDLKVRCIKWHSISFESHADAHKWEDWLKKVGFETHHEH